MLRVRLLGGFQIEGVDERALGTRKGRSLARRLAAEAGRPVSIGELAEILWGDDLPRNPADQLSVLVSRVRGVLGTERIRRGDAGYWLDADWFDYTELDSRTREIEQRLATGRVTSAVAAAEEALGLARGPLLPEEDGGWVVEMRAQAARAVKRARLAASAAYLAAGDAFTTLAAAGRVLDEDPYDESALRMVMRAHTAAGRPALALTAYEAGRRRLADDLAADPSAETQALHRGILRGEAIEAPPATVVSSLVGRDAELRQLDSLLRTAQAGRPAAAVIEAGPGMGKTALLEAWTALARASAVVVAGRCDELGRSIPLQPVLDGLAANLRAVDREIGDALLGAQRRVLGPLLSDTDSSTIRPVTVVADAESGRLELFTALAEVLGRLAGDRALVLAVDDLHAAMPGTAEFLTFVMRRRTHALVLAARRPLPGPDLDRAIRISPGLLTVDDAVQLAGADRGAALHARSGGHPLFLNELARAPQDTLPANIVHSVWERTAKLKEATRTVEAAAVLGPTIDVDLLCAATGRPVSGVLDDLERAGAAGLLRPGGPGLRFEHELVREALEAGVQPARRLALHRAAAAALSVRPGADPMLLATHARLAGDDGTAAQALAQAAALAADRHEVAYAERLLDESIELHDTGGTRLARGRLRLAGLELDAAREDAEAALRSGAGAAGFELAGWVAYYARRYDAARRYADEGAVRAADPEVRASCLALAGRVRHTRGDLVGADRQLREAANGAASPVRGVAQLWRAQLLLHKGRVAEAEELARRGLLDPRPAHPFAPLHGLFTLVVALGYAGRWGEALDGVRDLEAATARVQDRRFPPVNANVRGWLLRGAGLVEEAKELHEQAAGIALGPFFLEPRYAALLDLCEDRLAAQDLAGAERALTECDGILEWDGSMSWRHADRYRLLTARVALAGGDLDRCAEICTRVADSARRRGDIRYLGRSRVWAAIADARAGRLIDADALGRGVAEFLPVAGPDGWRDLAQLARATASDRWRGQAEALAARVAKAAADRSDVDGHRVAFTLRRELDRV